MFVLVLIVGTIRALHSQATLALLLYMAQERSDVKICNKITERKNIRRSNPRQTPKCIFDENLSLKVCIFR